MASTSQKFPDIALEYESLPPCHRIKLDLGGEVHARAMRYWDFISQLRTICSAGGCIFSDVKEAYGIGFPLVEAVISYELESIEVRFLIEKSSVYVVGYWDDGKWLIFSDCLYSIDSTPKSPFLSSYQGPCTKTLGFRPMYEAMRNLRAERLDRRKPALQVFFVHISEAVRFHPVANQVFKGLIGSDQYEPDFVPDPRISFQWYEDTPNKNEAPELVRRVLSPKRLFTHLGVCIPYLEEVDTFEQIDLLVTNWSKLSRIYVLYCLTGYYDPVSDSRLM